MVLVRRSLHWVEAKRRGVTHALERVVDEGALARLPRPEQEVRTLLEQRGQIHAPLDVRRVLR